MRILFLLLIISIFGGCKKNVQTDDILNDNYKCNTISILQNVTRNQLIASFDNSIIEAIASANAPDINGAMSNNKAGYFHVRFQLGISPIAVFAV